MRGLALLVFSALARNSLAFTPTPISGASTTRLYEHDPNPPPFGDWAMPAPVIEPAPAPAAWGQPAAGVAAPPASAPPAAGGDPVEVLQASQAATVAAIREAIPDLVEKPDWSWSGEPFQGTTATLQGFDAPGASNIAWLSDLHIPGKLSSLTINNGPLSSVPHLLSRCVVVGDELQVCVDVRPRAYGAFEMVDADGNYPGPEELGRKAFEYSAARNEFFGDYGTEEFQAVLDVSQFEGSVTLLPASEMDALTSSPLRLAVSVANTPVNVDAISNIRSAVASHWLNWALTTEHHRPGAPINAQHVYDSKFFINCYSALLPYYSDLFGAVDGAVLAAAESGPLDEAYVGGGS